MSVEIEPLELNFRRPFTVEVSQTLTLKNTGSTPLAFKVKTTAPRQYCVRPNAGRIEPGEDFDVTVLLQAMKSDPPMDARCRDKFLVQSAAITADKDFSNIASVLDNAEKGQLLERKIRVNWLAANSEKGAATVPLAAMTPNRQSALSAAADTPDVSRTFSSPSAGGSSNAPPPYTDEASTFEDTESPEATPSAPAASTSQSTELTYDELQAKLTRTEADLSNALGSGLRQRNAKSSSNEKAVASGQTAQAVRQSADGVSLKMVTVLCLLSFLLAYFFF